MKKAIMLVLLFIVSTSVVFAHGEASFAQAKELIQAKIPCDKLNVDDLENIGDYYMEQMHPGETHEQMDAMMGGEGSENLRQMHIAMAKNFYCGEHEVMGQGMMGMMMGRGTGMMPGAGEGMMN
jgi:hypothetical protein